MQREKLTDREDLEVLANAKIERAVSFIGEHGGIFDPPIDMERLDAMDFDDPIFREARTIRIELNDIGNALCKIGGATPPIMHLIGEIIRHLDVIVQNECFYMDHKVLFPCDWSATGSVTKKVRFELVKAMAIETRTGYAQLAPGESQLVVNGKIPVEETTHRRTYHSLHLMFHIRGKLHGALSDGEHCGWAIINLLMQSLRENMDFGHALGRVWDGYEIDSKALELSTPARDGLSTLTLISNLRLGRNGDMDTGAFSGDPFKSGFMTDIVLELVRKALRNSSGKDNTLVRGGRDPLSPLTGIV